jgi:hypothetical protein
MPQLEVDDEPPEWVRRIWWDEHGTLFIEHTDGEVYEYEPERRAREKENATRLPG